MRVRQIDLRRAGQLRLGKHPIQTDESCLHSVLDKLHSITMLVQRKRKRREVAISANIKYKVQ